MKKHVFTEFDLSEISAVDKPAQEGAMAAIIKRDDSLAGMIEKMIEPDEGAASFVDILADNERRKEYWETTEEFWPMLDALSESVRSIVADAQLSRDARRAMIATSVDDFLGAVLQKIPDAEQTLRRFLSEPATAKGEKPEKEDDDMADKPEDMQKELAAAIKRAESAEAKIAKAEEAAQAAQASADEAKAALDAFKAAEIEKNDETVLVGGKEIRKSAVGDDAFAALKEQAAEIAKANKAARVAKFAKQAEESYPSLPGEPVAKAAGLMAMEAMDKDARSALETMLAAGEEAMRGRFSAIGKSGDGKTSGTVSKAEALIEDVAKEIAKRDGCDMFTARTKAYEERPDLYNEYQKETAA